MEELFQKEGFHLAMGKLPPTVTLLWFEAKQRDEAQRPTL